MKWIKKGLIYYPGGKYEFDKKDLAKTVYSASWAIVDGSKGTILAGHK